MAENLNNQHKLGKKKKKGAINLSGENQNAKFTIFDLFKVQRLNQGFGVLVQEIRAVICKTTLITCRDLWAHQEWEKLNHRGFLYKSSLTEPFQSK